MTRDLPDLGAWPGVAVVRALDGGHRNQVWEGSSPVGPVAIRRSRRAPGSLRWELDLIVELDALGFTVPTPIGTATGLLSHGGIVVQRWIEGREPTSNDDWRLVASELRRLHAALPHHPQRPGCRTLTGLDRTATSVDADLSALPDDVADEVLDVFAAADALPTSVIHGDPWAPNLRITDDGRVGLLDWDESRVDVCDLDLANLGIAVLDDDRHLNAARLADAWEIANAWTAEPEYARHRLAALRAR